MELDALRADLAAGERALLFMSEAVRWNCTRAIPGEDDVSFLAIRFLHHLPRVMRRNDRPAAFVDRRPGVDPVVRRGSGRARH